VAEQNLSSRLLDHEAGSMLARLARVKPFALLEPMLPAAAITPSAARAIERYLGDGRRELRNRIHLFRRWLSETDPRHSVPAEAQRRFTLLRLRFNNVLSQFDLFADVLTQRSEHETGVWLSGLDIVAADALTLPGYFQPPAVICYLDRGPGAAIRRARTRLPGGTENPVAIIRVPRERMVGSGIASSLVHEVGHQAAALLDLVESLRPVLKGMQQSGDPDRIAWQFWERWISEIVADFWAVARIGIGATMGLMAVVSLPQAFVFRVTIDDPHPSPYVRVLLSCSIGHALYPHQQWATIAGLWRSFYPLDGLKPETRSLFEKIIATAPGFVALLVNHRPKSLRGKSIAEVMTTHERTPDRLAAYYETWKRAPQGMREASPTLVFAVLGQAKMDGTLSLAQENRMLAYLLTYWALQSTLQEPVCNSSRCAQKHSRCAQKHNGALRRAVAS
jgi:hypothetical protein